MITTKDVSPPTDLGNGLDGTIIMGLCCQHQDHMLEEISVQVIKILTTPNKIDLSSEDTTRKTTILDTMSTDRDHNISRPKINLGTGELTITIHDHLQWHDKIHLSQISRDKPDQIRLIPQCLTGLEIEIRAIIYPSTRNSQLSTMVTSQTCFDSLQQTMKLMNC